MGYVDENLTADEAIVYRTRLHWVIYVGPAVLLVLAISQYGSDVPAIGGVFCALGVFWGLLAMLDMFSSEFAVTDKRLIFKTGVVSRKTIELMLQKVESIRVDQSLLGRAMGYGTITVVGTGGTRNPFSRIEAPLDFRRAAQAQIPPGTP